MKRILLVVFLIALLGGGLAAASVFLHVGPLANLIKPKEPPGPMAPPPPPAHAEIPVGSFVVPVVQDHAISRLFGLDVALDVLVTDQNKVESQLPRIMNAFTLALYEVVPSHSDSHSAADKKAIHDRLVATGDRVVGKGLIQDVVLKSVYDR
jgi:flagellar basal body-associated protein FliL